VSLFFPDIPRGKVEVGLGAATSPDYRPSLGLLEGPAKSGSRSSAGRHGASPEMPALRAAFVLGQPSLRAALMASGAPTSLPVGYP
jgi:hypothetical protein